MESMHKQNNWRKRTGSLFGISALTMGTLILAFSISNADKQVVGSFRVGSVIQDVTIELPPNSLEVFDDESSVEPLTGQTDFDDLNDRKLTIRWDYSGDKPIFAWHVYVKRGDGGFFYLRNAGDGATRSFTWNDPDVNAQYQFRIWGIYKDNEDAQNYVIITQEGPMGYNLTGGAAVKLKKIANPDDIEPQTAVVVDDLFHSEDRSGKSDLDSDLERALALKFNPGDGLFNNAHIYGSTDAENYTFLGQTGAGDMFFFRFDANETFSQSDKWKDGPLDQTRYWFRVFAQKQEGGVVRMDTGPVSFHQESLSTPLPTSTLVPTTSTPTPVYTPVPTVPPVDTPVPSPTATPTTAVPLEGIVMENVKKNYDDPYLVEFRYALRDTEDRAVVVEPWQIEFVAKEDGLPVNVSDTSAQMSSGFAKQVKVILVMDYTANMADPQYGDSNSNGVPDAIETMEAAAKTLIGSLNEDAQIGIYEFHRNIDPRKVSDFATDKTYLSSQIDGAWLNQVEGFPGSSRLLDAIYSALFEFNPENPYDEQRYIIFFSSGHDQSSQRSVPAVVSAAKQRDVKLYGIGFGAEADTSAIAALASQTNGKYTFAETLEELSEGCRTAYNDLRGHYILRWITLERGSALFRPSFSITLDGYSDQHSETDYYQAADYEGDPLNGLLRFVGTEAVDNQTTVFLRMEYAPRYVRQIRLRIKTGAAFTASLVDESNGGLCADWTLSVQEDSQQGGYWIALSSSNPQNLYTAIPFGAFGPLLKFEFSNVASLNSLFNGDGDVVSVDQSLYEQTGGQTLTIVNQKAGELVETVIDENFTGASFAYAADVDGDGDMDILGSAVGANEIAWWEYADGYTKHTIDNQFSGAYSVTAADLNGDGNLDVLGAALSGHEIAWWENNGQSQFTKHTIDSNFRQAASITAADLDGDGDLDALGAALSGNEIAWWENDGQGVFTKDTIDGGFAGAVFTRAADLDDDGDLDVLGASLNGNEIAWWEYTGSYNYIKHTIDAGFQFASSVFAADLDGDGDKDVIGTALGTESIAWWENNGAEQFTQHALDASLKQGVTMAYPADLDGDGDIDLVGALGTENTILWWENDGTGQFTGEEIDDRFEQPYSVYAVDLDADGLLEILGAAYNSNEIKSWDFNVNFDWN